MCISMYIHILLIVNTTYVPDMETYKALEIGRVMAIYCDNR